MSQKGGKFEYTREIGRHYGKVDLDRVGFFDDQPPGPFDKYINVAPAARSDFKGRQLLAGQQNDLFDKVFKRIFDGEARAVPRANKRVEAGTGGRVMLPPSPSKLHSTPNDWFGCIGKPPVYFSPEFKDTGGKNAGGEPPNCKIKPNPLGGPGYVDICLNPYPKHPSEPYDFGDKNGKVCPRLQGDYVNSMKPPGGKLEGSSTKSKFLVASAPLEYFTPNPYEELKPGPTYVRPLSNEKFKGSKINGPGRFYVPFPKKPGGQHAGCFGKFPEYTSDTYQDQKGEVKLSTSSGPKFFGGGPNSRSKYTNSIINQVTGVSCNVKNYREYHERVYPLSR